MTQQCLATMVAVCLVFGLAGSSYAEVVTAKGTITAVDIQNRTISVSRETSSGQKTGSFTVAPDAKILLNGAATDFRSLASNQKVTLTYDTSLAAVTRIEAVGTVTDWIDLFDGKTLSGWQTDHPGRWSVQDGAIVGQSRSPVMSYLFCPTPFSDFELKAEVKINPTGYSGIFFRTTEKNGRPNGGYEVQIAGNSTVRDRTGSLVGIASVSQRLTQDDTWFSVHVLAKGPQITVRINDKTVVDIVHRNFHRGGFALQCMVMRQPTVVHFRNIKVRRL